ncbi:MAG: carbohydrate-binding family 9-like protein [Rikenellaceae bacterium]
MKELTVKKIESINELNDLSKHEIACVNWPQEFPYKPEVTFQIGYTTEKLYVKYNVEEQHIKAEFLNNNETVCKDSCVELFVQPDGSDYYYNLEFNCIGTALAARRITRPNAERFTQEQINKIERISSLPFESISNEDGGRWNLTIAIPFKSLHLDTAPKTMRANLYKCGDTTKEPHFVSWSEIPTESPNFHQPEFFGKLNFE